jgi:ribonuclease III
MMDKKQVTANHNRIRLSGTKSPVRELAALFNFSSINEDLFNEALTHSSYANEHNLPSNERLEFLGDSVLSLIVCNFLYDQYGTYSEGQLAKLKATIVSTPFLAAFSQDLKLDQFIMLGQGEVKTSGNSKQNVLADLFEAIIGAYFLNYGLEKTTEFVIPLINSILPKIISQSDEINAKTILQEIAQSQGLKPDYRIVKEEGPPHNKLFTVEVLLNNQVLGNGAGRSLKEAQNKAAAVGVSQLKKSPVS